MVRPPRLNVEDLIRRGFSESEIFGLMIGLSDKRYRQALKNVKLDKA